MARPPRPSGSHYRKTSKRVADATLRTHLTVPEQRVGARGFKGDSRRARTAVRGEIRQVMPRTSTYEGRRAYESRMGQRSYVERSVAHGRRRKAVLAAIAAAFVLVVAAAVAWFVYVGGINGRLVIADDALKEALASPTDENGAAYTLIAASFDGDADGADPDMLVLVRTDPAAGAATAVAIDGATRATLPDGSRGRIGDARAAGGDAAVVNAVEGIVGIQIAHYVSADASGFVALVDALGGVEVDVPEDISDPQAGDMTLSAGSQTLSGEQALFACRADDYLSEVEATRGLVVARVAHGVFQKVAVLDGLGFFGRMDELSSFVRTDMDVNAAADFLKTLSAIPAGNVMTGALPTYASTSGGVTYQVPVDDEVAAMMNRVRAGQAPTVDAADVLGSVDAAAYTLTVNNGGDVVGAAAEAAEMLTAAGFSVQSTGNAAQQVYDETFVVYKDDAHAEAAEAVVAALGVGRAIQDGGVYYSFDTDVLVVVGKDWRAVLAERGETVDADGNIVPAGSAAASDAADSADAGDTSGTAGASDAAS